MQALDLEEEEWEQFASGIAQLAEQRERKPKDFEAFKVRVVGFCTLGVEVLGFITGDCSGDCSGDRPAGASTHSLYCLCCAALCCLLFLSGLAGAAWPCAGPSGCRQHGHLFFFLLLPLLLDMHL